MTGEPTGSRKAKSDVHRDGEWHRSVHVWILTTDGRLLLQKRSAQKENHGGLWDVSAAGHVSAGETALETAIRETEEEIGLRLESSELQPVGITRESHVLNGGTYLDNEVHEVFLVKRDVDLSSLTLQHGEVDDVRLVTVAEMQEMIGRGVLVDHPHEYALIFAVIKAEGRRRKAEG